MTQEATIRILRENGIDVGNMSYNLLNDIIAVAEREAEKCFKDTVILLCEANLKGGAE